MNVLVTGGGGWIGRHVVAQLQAEGHDAAVLDRGYGHDVLHAEDVDGMVAGRDAVIHLAGVLGTHELFDTPDQAVQVNVQGTLNVVEACTRFGARYVGISMPDVNPSLYAATKQCAQRIAEAYHHAYGLPVAHVVAYNAYGPGQAFGPGHPQKIVPTFAVAGWRGDPIPVWGDGNLLVDLVHVEDVARVIVGAMRFGDGDVLHAGTGWGVTVNVVAEKVREWTGGRSEIVHLEPRKGERPVATARDVAPTWSPLGWVPGFSWRRVQATVDSYQAAA